jgi:dihydrofolate reductase
MAYSRLKAKGRKAKPCLTSPPFAGLRPAPHHRGERPLWKLYDGAERRKKILIQRSKKGMQAILHADKEWGIGKDNGLMFSLPTDMKFFRTTTKGGVVVMGRKTLESFPDGKPLKNRVNIVLSSSLKRDDCITVKNLNELKAELQNYPDLPVWVIGGSAIYRLLLPYCESVLVTRVETVGGADTFFPDLDKDENFIRVKRGENVDDNGTTIHFDEYKNLKVKNL